MMKKLIVILLVALSLVLFASCEEEKTVYTPQFTLADGFTMENERISGAVIGVEALPISEVLTTSEKVTVFSDTTADYYVEGEDALIPLESGENHLILRLGNGILEKEYYLDIECIAIRSFSISFLKPERTYHIGEAFDKSTIAVMAVTKDADEVEVTQYVPEYEFSEFGEHTVGIELGGFYESFSVLVTEEYRPTLDGVYHADGVSYMLEDGEVTLADAREAEGFFAVPPSVVIEGVEYPVTKIGVLAFEGARVTSVRIPEGVHTIENEAFVSCYELEKIQLPETLERIASFAFSSCSALSSVTVPDGITTLADGVFRSCLALTNVNFPKNLESIGARAFYGCESLVTLDFPSSLHTIKASAFHGCEKLSTVIVENLEFLGDEAFSACPALSVFAVGDVTEAGFDIFLDSENVQIYCKDSSSFYFKMKIWKFDPAALAVGELCVLEAPETFAIEDGFPEDEVFILALSEDGMHRLDDFEAIYDRDACGKLSVTLAAGEFTHTMDVFVSYVEELALDTDSRGAVYEVNVSEKTATLVRVPEWVKKSGVYVPEADGLFIVPTAVLRGSELYPVTDVREGAFDACENVSSVFVPILETK